ncbi:MAG: alpha-galactosidase [Oscillospiraceae bacterium]|nr:alpha-galactosidase [Oscillospiraceae bacterium]
MSIAYNEAAKTITIQTAETEYQMAIDRYGCLRHVYYGRKIGGEDLRELHRSYDRGFSGSPYRAGSDRAYSLDTVCQEFSSCGVGDFRVPSLGVQNADGSRCAELRYVSHEIRAGKYSLPGLPAAWDPDGSAETLEITLRDPVTALTVRLLYGVFPERNVIARTAIYENGGAEPIVLEKAGSVCLELPFGSWDLLHFHGRHCLERKPERLPVMNGIQTVGSRRGMSSHEHNPFLILCDRQATEDHGECIGLMYLWSGSFRAEVEREQFGSVRAVLSPGDESFRWTLAPGERFAAPEVLLSRAEGLTRLSQQFHRMVRENICRGEYRLAHRPVLINSWEAAYFDIRADRILDLARRAADLGMELFVLDDGWFHGRTDDNAGLGDWFENREKLPEGLDSLIRGIRETGLLFGLWVEPEMVSENSDLYRAHPDWALAAPGRAPMLGRNQLVLDLSRREVQDYIIEAMSGLLERYDISYVKWDFNRSVSDLYSHTLPAERQGEAGHRYVLGLYRVLETLTARFPGVLFEGCSGGGGRFDAGMLYYTPQIWCSDDTDPIERLTIQGGTSYGYPISTMGAHVSASPNHQTGRTTPLQTRGYVAMSGAFGYELDLAKLSEGELEEIRHQIQHFRQDEALLQQGLYYRLDEFTEAQDASAWLFVSEDRSRALLNVVVRSPHANAPLIHLKLKGLDPDARYAMEEDDAVRSGAALMYGGYTLPQLIGDYPAVQLHLKKLD